MKPNIKAVAVFLALFTGAGCASGVAQEDINPADPYEDINRNIFAFNKGVDDAVVKPLAKGWRFVVPEFVRDGIGNFFDNLDEPGNFVNNAIQLDGNGAARNVGRFGINSTFGILGLFDVASEMGIAEAEEDLGQGIRLATGATGSFIMLPLFGPSTTIDAVGGAIDNFVIGEHVDVTGSTFEDSGTDNAATAVQLINGRSEFLEVEETFGDSVLDEYSFLRDAYLQRREYETRDEADPDDFE